ncbi:MAG: hypothetical protein D6698_07890 [Gammaproteobacteria bacterium]|nr:MAG: hypothetical protein D6698_07890 [Gammaproteobacteria bacterium]
MMKFNILTAVSLSVFLTLLIFAGIYVFSAEETKSYPVFTSRNDEQTYVYPAYRRYTLAFQIYANFSMNILVMTVQNERGSFLHSNETVVGNSTSYEFQYSYDSPGSVTVTIQPVIPEDQNFTIGYTEIVTNLTPDTQYASALYTPPLLISLSIILVSVFLPVLKSGFLYFTYNPERYYVLSLTSPLVLGLGINLVPFAVPVNDSHLVFQFLVNLRYFAPILWFASVVLVLTYFSRRASRVQQLWCLSRGKQISYVSRLLSLGLDLTLISVIPQFLLSNYYLTPLLELHPDPWGFTLILALDHLSVLLFWSLVMICVYSLVDSEMWLFSGAILVLLVVQFWQSILPRVSASRSLWNLLISVLFLPLFYLGFKLYLISEVYS